jgi:hypothetical protein
MSNIIDFLNINGNIHIVTIADAENKLYWGDEPIDCYEIQDISFEMEENNLGTIGSSFFTSNYDMFPKATQEEKEKVVSFLQFLNN